ncbi:diguanylate cyclase domain-containing protein [Deinococcus misasensis]|uniref:diguanylate cyclase domain-containing protein n=1 Tax=Deinococcus misasensis TaxID=392413 RepID=UPI000691079C|nr:GGDEF domain-containing protein [Deinococcus misasensis]
MPDVPLSLPVLLVVDYFYDHQIQIHRGITHALDQSQQASLTFVGHQLASDNPIFQSANDVYGLICPERFSGALVSAATLGITLDDEVFSQYLHKLHPLKTVTIGRKVAGFPAVMLDNRPGMEHLCRHLLDRGYQRFVVVQGSPDNPESILREEVVHEVLSAQDLVPVATVTGDFYGPTAEREVARLIQQGVDFDVVVCLNDEMALGAIRALAQHGLQVPADVAVVGFDDIEEARHASPPLTTVRQEVPGLGQAAVQVLQNWNCSGAEDVVQASRLVVRESCGSLPEWLYQLPYSHAPEVLIQEIAKVVQGQSTPQDFLRHCHKAGDDATQTLNLKQLLLQCQQHFAQPQDRRTATELLLLMVGVVVGQMHSSGAAYQGLSSTNRVSTRLALSLTSQQDRQVWLQDAERYLHSLGLPRFFLVGYPQVRARIPEQAELLLTSRRSGPISVPFQTQALLPAEWQHEFQKGHLLVVPLFVKDHQHGLLVFEKPTDPHFSVENLRVTLSQGLHNLHITQLQQEYTHQLEQQVRERTRELEQEIVIRMHAEQALKAINQELQQSAMTDGLTGLFNRSALDLYLEREIGHHQERQSPLAVLLCDVDFFKQYNDLFGHLQGDVCLKQVAAVLKNSTRRERDFCARYGGEEFVVVLPNTGLQGAEVVARNLLKAMRLQGIPHPSSPFDQKVTFSLGVAVLNPQKPLAAAEVLHQADLALYQSKKQGRNRHTVFQTG